MYLLVYIGIVYVEQFLFIDKTLMSVSLLYWERPVDRWMDNNH